MGWAVASGKQPSRGGIFNDSLYTEAGGDARGYWSVRDDTVVATHGSGQPLRGFGAGRFYDRDGFSRRREPASPARPEISSQAAAGNGTGFSESSFQYPVSVIRS